MKKYILENRVKLIYEHRNGQITSFCIGFNAGAQEEIDEFKLGTAHAVEHMVSKGTINRTEKEINELCDEIFGFQNAMTNFPYAIYYGTCLSQDFKRGFDIYSDIVLNPTFPERGFRDEINIILEELKEWRDDIYQHCEDSLLYNAFNVKRIKNLIIGNEQSIRAITLDDIKRFYNKYYVPENCVISVCSSLNFETILSVVKKYFEEWNKEFNSITNVKQEINHGGIFIEEMASIKGAKLQYLFNIDNLKDDEVKALSLFNEAFGDGSSSILFNEIRTKRSLAYDVNSAIKNERGIKFFTIYAAVSEENIEKALDTINNSICEIKNSNGYFSEEKIKMLIRTIKLKRQLKLEKSIQLCKELTTYELMFGSAEKVNDEVENLEIIMEEDILRVINKTLSNPTIQIITPSRQ